MGLRGEVEGEIGLRKAGVRAERAPHRHQPKSYVSVRSGLSGSAIVD